MVIATNIPTPLWNNILQLLTASQWRITYAYDNFDAGIDFDFVILEKDGEEILMGWNNWFEGDLGCSEVRLQEVEKLINCKLKIGEPETLKPGVIALNRQWKEANRSRSK